MSYIGTHLDFAILDNNTYEVYYMDNDTEIGRWSYSFPTRDELRKCIENRGMMEILNGDLFRIPLELVLEVVYAHIMNEDNLKKACA